MIKVPYTVTADIAKYEGETFNLNPNPNYIKQKQIELSKLGAGLGYSLMDGVFLIEDLSRYCGFDTTNDIREIALQLEEDIAILYNGRLVSMCFCFPSGFRPNEKVGQTFMELHAPVADNQKLQRASDKVTEMISKPGAKFRRYVWTLTTSPELSRHPCYKPLEPKASTIDKLYFRQETQTTVGYNDGRTTFFFVKVDVTPFVLLPAETQYQTIDSVNSMSDAVLEYKGLNEIKKLLNQ
jgi:hypothetical protein